MEKDIIICTNLQPQQNVKCYCFTNSTSNREQISKIYRQLKKLIVGKNNPILMGYRSKQLILNRGNLYG